MRGKERREGGMGVVFGLVCGVMLIIKLALSLSLESIPYLLSH